MPPQRRLSHLRVIEVPSRIFLHPDFLHHPNRPGVIGDGESYYFRQPQCLEGHPQHGSRRLGREAFAPKWIS